MEKRFSNPEKEKQELLAQVQRAFDKETFLEEVEQKRAASGYPWVKAVNDQLQSGKSFLELAQPHLDPDRYYNAIAQIEGVIRVVKSSGVAGVELEKIEQEVIDDVVDTIGLVQEVLFGEENPDIAVLRHSLNSDSIHKRISAEQDRSGQDWVTCYMSCLTEVGPYLFMASKKLGSERTARANEELKAIIAVAESLRTQENKGDKNFPSEEEREELVQRLVAIEKLL